MVTETFHIILSIGDKHLRIIRIGSVGRIRQPEILPDHDTMTVASLIQFLVADLSYPVTHHRKVHISMVSHGDVVLTTPVIQVRLTESPVTATADKTTPVDKETQDAIILVEGHLSDTYLEILRVGYLIAYLKGEISVV